MTKLDDLYIPESRKRLLRVLGEARDLLLREPSPLCKEVIRTIDDVAGEFTGDSKFFHSGGHKMP